MEKSLQKKKIKKRIYLDFAGAAPVSARAKRALASALRAYGNPSAAHTEGREARVLLEEARTTIARLTEVKTDDVIFTSGATEANALAIFGHIRALMDAGRCAKDIHLLYLPTAHSSIVESARALARAGVAAEPLPILPEGRVDIQALTKILRPETVLVSMDAVCGETGTIWNTREVRQALEAKAREGKRALLHIDASQAPLTSRITRTYWGADMLVFDAQKVGGVRGIGALIARRTIPLVPLVRGGGHERGVRPGTPPVALAASFAAALAGVSSGRENFCASAERSRSALAPVLASIPQCILHTAKEQSPHIINVSLLGRDTDYLVALLDEAGFAVSTRSACETDAEGSRVLLALTGDQKRAASTLRISFGPTTRPAELVRFSRALVRAVAFLDQHTM